MRKNVNTKILNYMVLIVNYLNKRRVRWLERGLDWYPYLKHIIQLWSGYWVKQMKKTNQAVGEKNCLDKSGGGVNIQFVILEGKSSLNVLVEFYLQLPMGLKDTTFGRELKHLAIRRHELNYTYISVRTHI